MGKVTDAIDDRLRRFIEAQKLFFVATAPRRGHVNLSPKGMDTFRVIDASTVAYLDLTGSGAETVAHLAENGRITFMFTALSGPPMILRLYGRGRLITETAPDWATWRERFPAIVGARGVVAATIHRVATSCGYGVPLYAFERERPTLREWAERKGEVGLDTYRREHNARSIDGLPTGLGDSAAEADVPSASR